MIAYFLILKSIFQRVFGRWDPSSSYEQLCVGIQGAVFLIFWAHYRDFSEDVRPSPGLLDENETSPQNIMLIEIRLSVSGGLSSQRKYSLQLILLQ